MPCLWDSHTHGNYSAKSSWIFFFLKSWLLKQTLKGDKQTLHRFRSLNSKRSLRTCFKIAHSLKQKTKPKPALVQVPFINKTGEEVNNRTDYVSTIYQKQVSPPPIPFLTYFTWTSNYNATCLDYLSQRPNYSWPCSQRRALTISSSCGNFSQALEGRKCCLPFCITCPSERMWHSWGRASPRSSGKFFPDSKSWNTP